MYLLLLTDLWVVPSFFAVISNIALNILVQGFCYTYTYIYIRYIRQSRIARSQSYVCVTVVGNAKEFSKVVVPVYTSSSLVSEFQLFHVLITTWNCQSFNLNHSDKQQYMSPPHFSEVCVMPLCSFERSTSVPVFANQEQS